MKQSLVSIVIPVYNGANYLSEAIDSALAQTYSKKEIIVVNDGSNDDGATERIALGYGDQIRYFFKENGGSSSALNYGIERMRGEWFSWLSHDDLYLPDKIEAQMDRVARKGLDDGKTIIRCGTMLVDAQGKRMLYNSVQDEHYYTSLELLDRLMLRTSLNGCALLIPKTLLDEVGGFDTSLRYVNDWEMWIRFALHGASMDSFEEILVKNRIHGAQVSVQAKHLYRQEKPLVMQRSAEYIAKRQLGSDYMKILLYAGVGFGDRTTVRTAKQYLSDGGAYRAGTRIQCCRYRIQKAIGRGMRAAYHGIQNYVLKK